MIRRSFLARRSRTGRSRASVMLEFALVFPLALGIMIFAVDMGRLVMISTGLQDATSAAARAGARQGVAGSSATGPSREAFYDATSRIPGLANPSRGPQITSLVIESPRAVGGVCTIATPGNSYVRVRGVTQVTFILPGLNSIINGFYGTGDAGPGSTRVQATGVARCEVTR